MSDDNQSSIMGMGGFTKAHEKISKLSKIWFYGNYIMYQNVEIIPAHKIDNLYSCRKRCLILHGFRDSKRHVPLGVRVTKLIIFILMKQPLFAVYAISFYQSWYFKLEQAFHVKLLHNDFPISISREAWIVNL